MSTKDLLFELRTEELPPRTLSALSNAQPYAERCDWETQRVIGPYGYVHYEQVQVCR